MLGDGGAVANICGFEDILQDVHISVYLAVVVHDDAWEGGSGHIDARVCVDVDIELLWLDMVDLSTNSKTVAIADEQITDCNTC